jgi:hypothetical protein
MIRKSPRRSFIESVVLEAVSPGKSEASLLFLNGVVFALLLTLLATLCCGIVNVHVVAMLIMTVLLAAALFLYV